MTARRRRSPKPPSSTPSSGKPPGGNTARIGLRRLRGEDIFELVHPRSVLGRAEDMEEVRAMLAAGEIDVAVDELRWLLAGCPLLLEAHRLLGEVALVEGDLELARAHLGCAYQLGLAALPAEEFPGTLPYARDPNRAFLEAGRSLAECLGRLGKRDLAAEVVERLLALDPTDPLDVKKLLGTGDR